MLEVKHRRLILWITGILTAAALAGAIVAVHLAVNDTAPPAPADADGRFLDSLGIRYWLIEKTAPRALRIHHLRVDLDNPRIEVAAVPADDPDAAGPATSVLTPPMGLVMRARAVAFVNANPWESLPDKEGKKTTDWTPGLPVEVLGMMVSGGKVLHAPSERNCGFWIDADGAHIGNPGHLSDVREGVAGFMQLLNGGRNLHAVKPNEKMHPRTALGLDRSGRFLYLVVVDGRQNGYSEGMTYVELAEYMKSLGCDDAVNLDGGGSSVMILSDARGVCRVVNAPSTKVDGKSVMRPIPAGLAVRLRDTR